MPLITYPHVVLRVILTPEWNKKQDYTFRNLCKQDLFILNSKTKGKIAVMGWTEVRLKVEHGMDWQFMSYALNNSQIRLGHFEPRGQKVYGRTLNGLDKMSML